MTTIAFFNNKGGVGKTALVYHIAWMFSDLGVNTLAVDLDPQANLTAMSLDMDRLEKLWNEDLTVSGAIKPVRRALGNVHQPHTEYLAKNLNLIPGHLSLSAFEDKLSSSWGTCLSRDEPAFRVVTAFYNVIQKAKAFTKATIVLVDVGPNLGAINRSALIACDYVIFPLAPDLFSLQGIQNLGPTLREWRDEWQERLNKKPEEYEFELPKGRMDPLGYIVMQPGSMREDRPVKAYQHWMNQIPGDYRKFIRNETNETSPQIVDSDPYWFATMKHYRSLMPLAMDARKPMFHLKAADGAIGSHIYAAQDCGKDFKTLARKIANRCHLVIDYDL